MKMWLRSLHGGSEIATNAEFLQSYYHMLPGCGSVFSIGKDMTKLEGIDLSSDVHLKDKVMGKLSPVSFLVIY